MSDFNEAMRHWKHARNHRNKKSALEKLIRSSFTLTQKKKVHELAESFGNKKLLHKAIDSWRNLAWKEFTRAKTVEQQNAVLSLSPNLVLLLVFL